MTSLSMLLPPLRDPFLPIILKESKEENVSSSFSC
jgi:hypothetical protein